MRGCSRCGHRKKDHALPGKQAGNQLCIAMAGNRVCLCPRYIRV